MMEATELGYNETQKTDLSSPVPIPSTRPAFMQPDNISTSQPETKTSGDDDDDDDIILDLGDEDGFDDGTKTSEHEEGTDKNVHPALETEEHVLNGHVNDPTESRAQNHGQDIAEPERQYEAESKLHQGDSNPEVADDHGQDEGDTEQPWGHDTAGVESAELYHESYEPTGEGNAEFHPEGPPPDIPLNVEGRGPYLLFGTSTTIGPQFNIESNLLYAPLQELFEVIKQHEFVGGDQDSELELAIIQFGLSINEGAEEAHHVSLGEIQSVYLDLMSAEGNYEPRPLALDLAVRPAFGSMFQKLKDAANAGLGLSQCYFIAPFDEEHGQEEAIFYNEYGSFDEDKSAHPTDGNETEIGGDFTEHDDKEPEAPENDQPVKAEYGYETLNTDSHLEQDAPVAGNDDFPDTGENPSNETGDGGDYEWEDHSFAENEDGNEYYLEQDQYEEVNDSNQDHAHKEADHDQSNPEDDIIYDFSDDEEVEDQVESQQIDQAEDQTQDRTSQIKDSATDYEQDTSAIESLNTSNNETVATNSNPQAADQLKSSDVTQDTTTLYPMDRGNGVTEGEGSYSFEAETQSYPETQTDVFGGDSFITERADVHESSPSKEIVDDDFEITYDDEEEEDRKEEVSTEDQLLQEATTVDNAILESLADDDEQVLVESQELNPFERKVSNGSKRPLSEMGDGDINQEFKRLKSDS